MSAKEFLARLTAALEDAGIDYMIAGSVASSFHGMPRTTQDIDIVVDIDAASAERLLGRLDPGRYYVSDQAVREALAARTQFNVIDLDTGWKADLIVRKRRPFSASEFARRRPANVLGLNLVVAAAEDVIIAKLEWARASGGSERQLRDVAGIIGTQGSALDLTYLDKWLADLSLESEWAAARALADGG